MENKIYEITIPLKDYNNLKNYEFMYDDIMREFKVLIEDAELNYSKDDLNIDVKFRNLVKKCCQCSYKNRVEELKRIAIGPFNLNDLKEGNIKEISFT